jgi:hypothetical protein
MHLGGAGGVGGGGGGGGRAGGPPPALKIRPPSNLVLHSNLVPHSNLVSNPLLIVVFKFDLMESVYGFLSHIRGFATRTI